MAVLIRGPDSRVFGGAGGPIVAANDACETAELALPQRRRRTRSLPRSRVVDDTGGSTVTDHSQAYVTGMEPRSGRKGDIFLELLKYSSDVRVIRTRDQKWYVIARRAGVTSGRTHPELVRALWGALSKLEAVADSTCPHAFRSWHEAEEASRFLRLGSLLDQAAAALRRRARPPGMIDTPGLEGRQ